MPSTDTANAFDGKAEIYAQCRHDYAPQAIDAIVAIAGLGRNSAIADLGAGTGMLARHFADRVGQLFAIEPNAEMRAVAHSSLRPFASTRILPGTAHDTGLPDHSVDAVAAGRAIHWFDAEPSRAEIRRILRPGGWLIVVRTPITDAYSSAAIARLHDGRISGHEPHRWPRPPQADVADYFGGDNYIRLAYPCEAQETWPQFFGRMQSLSSSPRRGDPGHDGFEREAHAIFDRGAVNGVLRLEYATEVLMKQVAPAAATPGSLPLREEEIEHDIVTRFGRVVARFRNHVAVKDGAEEWTYGELDGLADRIAGLVLRESPERSKPVALLFDHGIGGIASIMGVLKAGRAYSALTPGHPLDRQRQTLDDLRPGLLLCAPPKLEMAQQLAREGLRCAPVDARSMQAPTGNPQLRRSADDIAAVYYTSGSTGRPKGIMHSHRQLLHRAWVSAQLLGVKPGCRTSQIVEIAFVTAAADILVPLLSGATVCPFDARRHSLRELAQWLHRDRIEIVRMPVALFHRFLDALDEDEQFPHVRCLQPAGKLLWPSLDRYRRHFARECRLVRQLAATETSLLTTMMVHHDTPCVGASVPVGYPIPGKRLWLERAPGVPAGIGEAGEIVVKSRYLHAGVWRRPETELAPGAARLHRTGDLARWLPDGSLEFIGRLDSRVKVRGFTVDLEEVEAAIGDTGAVSDAAVVAKEDSAGEAQLTAYAVPSDSRVTPSGIRIRLAERVPNYMIPSHIVLVDALPLTANGKIDRAALGELGRPRRVLPANHIPPRTPIETAIAAIWEDVLAAAPIGIHDEFLLLGGDSIAAARIANQIRGVFLVDLSALAMFETATIASLAELIARQRPGSPGGDGHSLP